MNLDYKGEFGTEVVSFVPFVFFLKIYGLLPKDTKVRSYAGMRPYYFFLEDDEIEFYGPETKRDYVLPDNRDFLPTHMRHEDALITNYQENALMLKFFVAPPFHHNFSNFPTGIFDDDRKKIVIIQNKFNNEWWEGPLNYLEIGELRDLCAKFKDWNVVYIRSNDYNGTGYSRDHNEDSELKEDALKEKDMLRSEFPNVHIFEDMIQKFNIDFNTLKNILFGSASLTVSTHGGQAFFDMYFCSKHIVYTKSIPSYAFNYDKEFFQKLHLLLCPVPHEVMFASNTDELNACVDSVV
jgi:hypothetical protein